MMGEMNDLRRRIIMGPAPADTVTIEPADLPIAERLAKYTARFIWDPDEEGDGLGIDLDADRVRRVTGGLWEVVIRCTARNLGPREAAQLVVLVPDQAASRTDVLDRMNVHVRTTLMNGS